MSLSEAAEMESARLLDVDAKSRASAWSGGRATTIIAKTFATVLGVFGVAGLAMHGRVSGPASASAPGSSDSLGGTLIGLAAAGEAPEKAEPFAVVPVVWTIITKEDGTGHYSKEKVHEMVALLNHAFNGTPARPPQGPDVEAVLASDDCYHKCNVAFCYKGGTATDLKAKEEVGKACHCSASYCAQWGFKYDDEKIPKLEGPRLDTGISFEVKKVEYVKNDEWHLQCCCTHAGFKYDIKQNEIFDQVVDKSTVRNVANLVVCDMTTLGGGTAGQSMIAGTPSCSGGPGIMLDHGAIEDVHYGLDTLVHEFGHNFGLFHTFNEVCEGDYGACKKEEVCDPKKNAGDKISDTPVHFKQESCNDADSCPEQPGKDPLDNYMSYSGCDERRFTAQQVEKMHQTVSDYFPGMLVKAGGEPNDLPCDPEFPGGEVPEGYAPPRQDDAGGGGDGGGGGGGPPTCQLEVGQCDKYDGTGCHCVDSRLCCEGHGCGGGDGVKQCLPCSWKGFDTEFTPDACPESQAPTEAPTEAPAPTEEPAPEPTGAHEETAPTEVPREPKDGAAGSSVGLLLVGLVALTGMM